VSHGSTTFVKNRRPGSTNCIKLSPRRWPVDIPPSLDTNSYSPSVDVKSSSVTSVTCQISLTSSRVVVLPWFHLLQHVNAKRDCIYCKTRQWKYYWLQNATRYVISKWWLLPCYQESIIDCKTRFKTRQCIIAYIYQSTNPPHPFLPLPLWSQ
jgi:hypothetical protein